MKKQSVAKIERRALEKMRARLVADCGLSVADFRAEVRAMDAAGHESGPYAVRLPSGMKLEGIR